MLIAGKMMWAEIVNANCSRASSRTSLVSGIRLVLRSSNSLPSGTPPKPNLIGGTYYPLRRPATLCVSLPGAAGLGGACDQPVGCQGGACCSDTEKVASRCHVLLPHTTC